MGERGSPIMILKTSRLILRPWEENDARALYEYAKDPAVGPVTGWPVHTSIEESLRIIKEVLKVEESYAVVHRSDILYADKKTSEFWASANTGSSPIGSISLMIGEKSNLSIGDDEGEIGFWLGVPFWGHGLIPEAVLELVRHGFADLDLKTIWSGYFDGNEKSKRVQEKCWFTYHHTEKDIPWPLMNDIRTEHITCITRKEWLNSFER
jgi:RimJ/RimL family protein N-acetyltransferase